MGKEVGTAPREKLVRVTKSSELNLDRYHAATCLELQVNRMEYLENLRFCKSMSNGGTSNKALCALCQVPSTSYMQ